MSDAQRPPGPPDPPRCPTCGKNYPWMAGVGTDRCKCPKLDLVTVCEHNLRRKCEICELRALLEKALADYLTVVDAIAPRTEGAAHAAELARETRRRLEAAEARAEILEGAVNRRQDKVESAERHAVSLMSRLSAAEARALAAERMVEELSKAPAADSTWRCHRCDDNQARALAAERERDAFKDALNDVLLGVQEMMTKVMGMVPAEVVGRQLPGALADDDLRRVAAALRLLGRGPR